jgi:hypothetical protein
MPMRMLMPSSSAGLSWMISHMPRRERATCVDREVESGTRQWGGFAMQWIRTAIAGSAAERKEDHIKEKEEVVEKRNSIWT